MSDGLRSAGFTLVEILVVLVIAGLLTGIALPRLQGVVQSVETAGQRKSVVHQLEGLGFRAYAEGKPLVLTTLPGDERDPLLRIPQGWRVILAGPVTYGYNGACSGGRLEIVSPYGDSRIYDMKPPLCRLDRETPGGE